MTKADHLAATEHIAKAWSHMDDGKPGECLAELDKAIALLRPSAEPPQPAPASVRAKWTGKPVETEDDWWPDTPTAARALHASLSAVRNACNGYSSPYVRGVVVRYSRYRTRAGWEAGRKLARASA